MTLKFDGWPWKIIWHVFYTTSSYVYHFRSISELKLELQSTYVPNLGQIRWFFFSHVTLQFDVWPWKSIGHHFLCYFKLCASFCSHRWFQTGDTVRKRPICVKIDNFFSRVILQFDVWPCKNNKAPLLCYLKFCASFRSHWWIQTAGTVQKRPIWIKSTIF